MSGDLRVSTRDAIKVVTAMVTTGPRWHLLGYTTAARQVVMKETPSLGEWYEGDETFK